MFGFHLQSVLGLGLGSRDYWVGVRVNGRRVVLRMVDRPYRDYRLCVWLAFA